MLFSEPKIPQSTRAPVCQPHKNRFQCSSASRKFLNTYSVAPLPNTVWVSVLFSEPKIPQFLTLLPTLIEIASFSALQRAENSSILVPTQFEERIRGFSALQRAENSSIHESAFRIATRNCVSVLFSEPKIPQSNHPSSSPVISISFSALQRAENSSICV